MVTEASRLLSPHAILSHTCSVGDSGSRPQQTNQLSSTWSSQAMPRKRGGEGTALQWERAPPNVEPPGLPLQDPHAAPKVHSRDLLQEWERDSSVSQAKSALGPLYALIRREKKRKGKKKRKKVKKKQKIQNNNNNNKMSISPPRSSLFGDTHILHMEEPAEPKRKVTDFSKAANFKVRDRATECEIIWRQLSLELWGIMRFWLYNWYSNLVFLPLSLSAW